MMFGCKQRQPAADHLNYKNGLSYRAWAMADSGASFDEFFPVQQEAVRQLKSGNSQEDPVAVLEQTGYFLFAAGRLEEALPYFEEALDSLYAHPERPAMESTVMLYGDISQFYDRLGMTEHAIAYSDTAIAVSRKLDGLLISDLWRFRSQIFANINNQAKSFACLDSAYASIRRYSPPADTAFLLAIIDGVRANLILSNHALSADSVNLAANLLENIREVSSDSDYQEYTGPAGYVRYLQGNKTEGIQMMEEAVDQLRDIGDLEMTFLEMRRLIDVCTEEHRFDKVSKYFNEYTELSDSMSRARQNLDMVIAKVREDVDAKERENKVLQEELKDERRHNIIMGLGIVLLVIVAIIMAVRVRRHYKRIKRRHAAEHERRIEAEAAADSAKQRIECIKNEIVDSEATDGDILHRTQFIGNNRAPFLRAFNAIYPDFAADLRKEFPALTDTDEIFCMLIFLKHSTEEISVYLNISRASVNSARYRIRTKLQLPKDVNLDKYLQSRKVGE